MFEQWGPAPLGLALAQPGLVWLVAAITVAGTVRGFTGFGTALIFMPVATQYLPLPEAILLIGLSGLGSTTVLVPRAWVRADRGDVIVLALAAVLMVPVGLYVALMTDPLALRWIVSGVVFLTLLAIVAGWRWRVRPGPAGHCAIGCVAGCVGGLTGLTGPVVIVFYLAGARTAESVRANVILFLAALDLAIVVSTAVAGVVTPRLLWIALLLMIPYIGAVLIGQVLFRPEWERIYRIAAYTVVALALLSGLPVFD